MFVVYYNELTFRYRSCVVFYISITKFMEILFSFYFYIDNLMDYSLNKLSDLFLVVIISFGVLFGVREDFKIK